MKNKIVATFLLTLLVVVGLEAMYFLPKLSLGGKPLRRVDLLSDVRPDKVEPAPLVADSDTLVLPPPVRPAFVDTCKTGLTCIEDYSDSTKRGGLRFFYEALLQRQSLGRPVRIAYFGDSFIEADILTSDLRNMLQKRFGGCGVGYVQVTSRISGYRPTVGHSFSGWNSHFTTDSIGFDRSRQDISNSYSQASAGASVTLKGQRKYTSLLDTCQVSTFYLLAPDSVVLSAEVNGREPVTYALAGDSALQAVSVRGNIGSVRWKVLKSAPNALFYGVTMDPESGIVVDNFSTRGSSGQQLGNIPMKS